jgi:hypothetical protein
VMDHAVRQDADMVADNCTGADDHAGHQQNVAAQARAG